MGKKHVFLLYVCIMQADAAHKKTTTCNDTLFDLFYCLYSNKPLQESLLLQILCGPKRPHHEHAGISLDHIQPQKACAINLAQSNVIIVFPTEQYFQNEQETLSR